MSRRTGLAWAIISAMSAELRRQAREGTLMVAMPVDDLSGMVVEGRIDLAMLANVTELALIEQIAISRQSRGEVR